MTFELIQTESDYAQWKEQEELFSVIKEINRASEISNRRNTKADTIGVSNEMELPTQPI